MSKDSSNDVVIMESAKSQAPMASRQNGPALDSDKPLQQFFKKLVFNARLRGTALTNKELENILSKEFNITIESLHVLELDIYLTTIKTYLKAWPMWDECEKTMKDMTENYEDKEFVNLVDTKYKCLHTYLKKYLRIAKKGAAELLSQLTESEKNKPKELPVAEDPRKSEPPSLVLEIEPSRQQLDKLICRQPIPGPNKMIFNVNEEAGPSHIRGSNLSLEAILNWWSVKITLSLQSNVTFLTRETTHELEHFLVNLKNKTNTSPGLVKLNEEIMIKENKEKIKRVTKRQMMGCLNLLSRTRNPKIEGQEIILDCLKKDLEQMRYVLVPAQYRRYLNRYPYIRYLFTEAEVVNESDQANYDIQLKETMSPMHQFSVGAVDTFVEKMLPPDWLKVECVICNVSYTGENLVKDLKQHFGQYHLDEPDWQCTKCDKNFLMSTLAENWWHHCCDDNEQPRKLRMRKPRKLLHKA